MRYPVYVERDSKAGFIPTLMLEQNDATMSRAYGFMINNRQTVRGYSPSDYDLFKIGFFDTESGEFEPILPEFITNGVNLVNEN